MFIPLPNVMPAQRQQNIVRIPARNQEASVRKFRLNNIQIDELATEFNQWRQRQLHVNGREHNSRKRIELFSTICQLEVTTGKVVRYLGMQSVLSSSISMQLLIVTQV